MQLSGRRLSDSGKLHLVKNNNQNDATWYTVCGRKLRPDYAMLTEQFNFGEDCCNCCTYKYKHPVKQLKTTS